MKIEITIDDNELKELLLNIRKDFMAMPEEAHLPDDGYSHKVTVTNDLKEKTSTTSITELPFSVRVQNALRSADICTLADLLACTEQYLLRIRNLGGHSYREIVRYLRSNDLELGILPPVWKVDFYSGTTARLSDNSGYRQFDTWQERDAFLKKMNGK